MSIVLGDRGVTGLGRLPKKAEHLAPAMSEFHFGMRFASPADLAAAQSPGVIKINVAGSEATRIWDPDTRLLDAWRARFQHYGSVFRVGAANGARGHRPVRPGELIGRPVIERG